MQPCLGDLFDGKYLLRRELGRGGMCIVYEATHAFTRRCVAVKILRDQFVQNDEARERLLREAIAIGSVHDPGVIDIFDAGTAEGNVPFVVLEMLEGRSLEGLLAARGTLPISDVVYIGRKVAMTLAACHREGVVHRDIKPGNILIARTVHDAECLKIIDFGVAHTSPSAHENQKLTLAETILGTAEYMAPEQLMHPENIDERADIYGLGVTLYEALTATVPHGGNFREVLLKHATETFKPPRSLRPEIPDALDKIIQRMLAINPDDRYRYAEAVAEDLAATQLGHEPKSLLQPQRAPQDGLANIKAMLESVMSRRKQSRAPYMTPVTLEINGVRVEARSEDISEGGLLIITNRPLPEKEFVDIEFSLPASGEMLRCRAEIRWSRMRVDNPHAPCASGLQFLGVDERATGILRHYVMTTGYPE